MEGPTHVRQKLLYIHPSFLIYGFHGGAYRIIEKGVPQGAKVVGAGFEERRGMFFIVIEHPSFDEIKIGDELPYLDGPVITRIYPGDVV